MIVKSPAESHASDLGAAADYVNSVVQSARVALQAGHFEEALRLFARAEEPSRMLDARLRMVRESIEQTMAELVR